MGIQVHHGGYPSAAAAPPKMKGPGPPPDVTKPIPKGTKFLIKGSLSQDAQGGFVYSVKGNPTPTSKYPGWVKPGVQVIYMSHDNDYWIRCHKSAQPSTAWYFPFTDLETTEQTVSSVKFGYMSSAYGNPKPTVAVKPTPKAFVSKLPEAEKLVEEMLQLTGQCATDLHATARLNDPYKEKDVAMAWVESVNAIQAQLVGWSMDLQEKLEDAQLAIEKEEVEEIRRNATLAFFADADY